MTVSIEDFMKKTPAKSRGKSALRAFTPDIGRLRNSGYSLQQIVDFLKDNGVASSVQTVSSHIRRHLESEKPVRTRRKA